MAERLTEVRALIDRATLRAKKDEKSALQAEEASLRTRCALPRIATVVSVRPDIRPRKPGNRQVEP